MGENSKDIFELFRDIDVKVAEEPSPQAWQKLERKLDARRKPKRTLLLPQPIAVAATILFLICLGGFFTVWLLKQSKKELAINTPNEKSVNNIPNTSNDVATTATISKENEVIKNDAPPLPTVEQKKVVINENTPTPSNNASKNAVTMPAPSIAKQANESAAVTSIENDDSGKEDKIVESIAKDKMSAPMPAAAKSLPKTESMKEKMPVANAEETLDDVVVAAKKESRPSPSLEQLTWILGVWEKTNNKETWIRKDRMTFAGTIEKDNKTIADLNIIKQGANLLLRITKNGESVGSLMLTDISGNEVVFQNGQSRVIIQQNNDNTLSTTFRGLPIEGNKKLKKIE